MYPCHSLVISMDTATGKQRFFTGHTNKVHTCMSPITCMYALITCGAAGLLYRTECKQVPAGVRSDGVTRSGEGVGGGVREVSGPVPESPSRHTHTEVCM